MALRHSFDFIVFQNAVKSELFTIPFKYTGVVRQNFILMMSRKQDVGD
jgi:hypothetical protein